MSVFNALSGALSGSSLLGSVALGMGAVVGGYIAVKYLGSYFGGIVPRGNAEFLNTSVLGNPMAIVDDIANTYNGMIDETNVRVSNSEFKEFGITNRDGSHNNAADAWRHAESNIRIAKKYGTLMAWLSTTYYEISSTIGYIIDNPNSAPALLREMSMDLHNNAEGRRVAGTNKTAFDLLRENSLDIIYNKMPVATRGRDNEKY